MRDKPIKRVVVVGNVAGGKTRLSRSLAKRYELPLYHVDALQFTPDLKIKDLKETRAQLKEVEEQEYWLIDGYGPLDMIVQRFLKSDCVVFIDLPLWRHQWWLFKRQVSMLWGRRHEMPPQSRELNWAHTKKMYQSMKSSHKQMRPELLRIFSREEHKKRVLIIRTLSEWNKVFAEGLYSFE